MKTPAGHHQHAARRPRWTLSELLGLGISLLLILSPLAAFAFALLAPAPSAAQTGTALSISKVAISLTGGELTSVLPGQYFYYQIRVQTSSASAVNATLTDTIPGTIQDLVLIDNTGGACTLANNQLTCSLSITAQRGASALIRSRVAPSARPGSQITNTAVVSAGSIRMQGSQTLTVGGAVPPTATRTPTRTPVPPTATRTPTATPVPLTATRTPTATRTKAPVAQTGPSATATRTPVKPTASSTPSATAKPQSSATPSKTATLTPTATTKPSTTPAGAHATANTSTDKGPATATPTRTAKAKTPTAQPTSQPPRRTPVQESGGRPERSTTATTGRIPAHPTQAAGGAHPTEGRSDDLGGTLPETSGGYQLWFGPLLGSGLLLHTIRTRRARVRV